MFKMLLQFPDTLSKPLLVIAVLLIVVAVLILIFWGLVQLNRMMLKSGTHPAIVAFAHEAIVLAYKTSEAVFDDLDVRLHGVQKKEVADAIYDLLPDTITIGPFGVHWKTYVTRDKFSEVVQMQYDLLVTKFGVVKSDILKAMEDEVNKA